MNDFPKLTKTQASFIKSLSKSTNRKNNHRILVEGIKCCEELINSKYDIDYFVVSSYKNKKEHFDNLISAAKSRGVEVFDTNDNLFNSISNAVTPEGILAVALPHQGIFNNNLSFILLDNIADPGNMGTIIRTADWFGIEQILVYGSCVDRYSPKVIRSTMGSIFRMEIICVDDNDTDFLSKLISNIPLYAAAVDGKENIKMINPVRTFGLVVGNETRGISSELKKIITKSFYISGSGRAESLNVGIATGISLFHFMGKI